MDAVQMPTQTLVQCVADDGSSDYMDGDDPGYAWCRYDEETGLLVFHYQPDDDPELDEKFRPRYGATRRVFREVTDP